MADFVTVRMVLKKRGPHVAALSGPAFHPGGHPAMLLHGEAGEVGWTRIAPGGVQFTEHRVHKTMLPVLRDKHWLASLDVLDEAPTPADAACPLCSTEH